MTVDYDLVILGGSAVARYAAAEANRWQARVALIEPETEDAHPDAAWLTHQALLQAGQLVWQSRRIDSWGLHWDEAIATAPKLYWQELLAWSHTAADALADANSEQSLPLLAAAGVDVVLGQGRFCPVGHAQRSPHRRARLAVTVNGRELRSRAYLLAPGTLPLVPSIPGLAATNYLTLDTLWQQSWETLPDRIMILGNEPQGIELAQALNRLGSQVTLITPQKWLLPQTDRDIANLIQAQLEAEGVTFLMQTEVTQIGSVNGQTWVRVGDRTLETDRILLALGRHVAMESVDLECAGVTWHRQGIAVNQRLQTSNDRIYACGDALGGYAMPHLARSEASLAVHNALFFSTAQINYRQIPWGLLTDPPSARVGLTEAQAHQHHGDKVLVLRQHFKTAIKAQLQDKTTGVCKLIVSRDGQILGAHIVGAEASDLIATIALAMQQRLRLQAIAQLPCISPTFSEIIQHAAEQWQHQRRRPWQRNLLDSWFNICRSMALRN
jgi:pyruvate/2-oxoglutarate dehydrogenase complex dihydrolipoamide dehydrogenase (E3) component